MPDISERSRPFGGVGALQAFHQGRMIELHKQGHGDATGHPAPQKKPLGLLAARRGLKCNLNRRQRREQSRPVESDRRYPWLQQPVISREIPLTHAASYAVKPPLKTEWS